MSTSTDFSANKEAKPLDQSTLGSSGTCETTQTHSPLNLFYNASRLARSWFMRSRVDDIESQADAVEDVTQFQVSGSDGTMVRQLEKCPEGYPRLAAFNASEQNFMLYRGFSCIHARLLLNLQTDIQLLESELDSLDRFHSTIESEKVRLQCWDSDTAACKEEKEDGDRTRADILEDLRTKVCQYDELLIKARELVSFQRPTERDYKSVRNWFRSKAPLVDEEQAYILWKEDIVTLRHGREWASFDGLVEQMLHKINCRLIRWLFCTEDQRRKTTDDKVYYFSPSRVAKLVNLVITSVIFVLLAAPVLVMYKLSCLKTTEAVFAAIGVLMVFALLFAAALSMLTKARRHELFAASAAYCAVLVVFIGSTNFA